MANTLTIYIKPDKVTYDPPPPDNHVRRGGTVNFVMSGRTDTVDVTFDSGNPLGLTTGFLLNGANPALNSAGKTVTTNANPTAYPFTATPVSTPGIGTRKIMEPEPPGTVHGDLDVDSDAPPEG